ncbi:MAG TPA: hypothetical protein ENN43_05385, partial [bacterium]|nr:hypothetical protein [bacterium]
MRGQANAARHKNTGCIYITSFLAVTAFILLTPFLSKASEITLADVAEAQEQATDGIETRSEIVETNTEAGGKSTTFVYEYTAITDPDTGKRKTLVTSHGRFQMQFMVDEEEMSVTYLMGGGKKMKVTLTAEQQAQIEEMMSLNMIHGSGGSMFASNTGGLR